MDKHRIAAVGRQLKSALEEPARKVTERAERQAEGDRAAGRLHNATCRAKDGVRGMADD